MCRRCDVQARMVQGGQGGRTTQSEGTKKWEQQGCEVLLVAGEAQALWMRTLSPQERRNNPCSHADLARCG